MERAKTRLRERVWQRNLALRCSDRIVIFILTKRAIPWNPLTLPSFIYFSDNACSLNSRKTPFFVECSQARSLSNLTVARQDMRRRRSIFWVRILVASSATCLFSYRFIRLSCRAAITPCATLPLILVINCSVPSFLSLNW